MSHRRKSHGGSLYNMSDLLLGSVPDEQLYDSNRLTHPRRTDSNDLFSSAANCQYPPPRLLEVESPASDDIRRLRDTSINRFIAMPFTPNTSSRISKRSDSIGYNQFDSLRTAEELSHDIAPRRTSMDYLEMQPDTPQIPTYVTGQAEHSGHSSQKRALPATQQPRRRPLNQDEFDGPTQLLPQPLPEDDRLRARVLPDLPVCLNIMEQDELMRRYNDTLAFCAFHFVAKYQFPVLLERDKPPIRNASDRDWTEWAYLLKRLATKRRIPARVLYENQIKHLVTILENSIPIRNARSRDSFSLGKTMKDDYYLLQLVSAGIQVARILMDSVAMQELVTLYVNTEALILERRSRYQRTVDL